MCVETFVTPFANCTNHFVPYFLHYVGVAILVRKKKKKKAIVSDRIGNFLFFFFEIDRIGNLNPNAYETSYGMSVRYSLLQKFKMIIDRIKKKKKIDY